MACNALMLQVQSLCKMAGETKRALWQPHVTQAGRMRRKVAACGTALAPREAGHRGGRGAMVAGVRATLGRSPAARWVNIKNGVSAKVNRVKVCKWCCEVVPRWRMLHCETLKRKSICHVGSTEGWCRRAMDGPHQQTVLQHGVAGKMEIFLTFYFLLWEELVLKINMRLLRRRVLDSDVKGGARDDDDDDVGLLCWTE